MKHLCTIFATIGLLTAFSVGAWADEQTLRFDTMNGVNGPFVGRGDNPFRIRGVRGGGRPWVVARGRGEVDADGELDVEVRGLIIPASEGSNFGRNPAPFFKLVVSCLSVDDSGFVKIVNVLTDNGAEVMDGDPQNGDARFKTNVDLPTPCVAPILFVTSPGGSWFAATGL